MELSAFDILAPGLPVVFCGINPSTQAAASGHNFGSASNHFWPVPHLAGFTPARIAAQNDRRLLGLGCGITAAEAMRRIVARLGSEAPPFGSTPADGQPARADSAVDPQRRFSGRAWPREPEPLCP